MILVIDDSDPERKLVRKVLESDGFTVREAADGFEGVTLAIETRPELVVCDLKMPGKDGFETMREIRAALPNTRFVAISGFLFGFADYAVRMQDIGVSAVVEKPFGSAYLLKTVREALTAAA
jgi:CheY-like chemotaxis protein